MASATESKKAKIGLPIHLFERIAKQVPTPTDLLNLAMTCSPVTSLIESMPWQPYITDARFQRLRAENANGFAERHPSKMPLLVHAIRTAHVYDLRRHILPVYRTESPLDCCEILDPQFPSPVEAAIMAHRLDVLKLLLRSACSPVIHDSQGIISGFRDAFAEWNRENCDCKSYDCRCDGERYKNSLPRRPHTAQEVRHLTNACVLACVEGQEEMATLLQQRGFCPTRFDVWVMTKFPSVPVTGFMLRRRDRYFPCTDDPALPLMFEAAVEIEHPPQRSDVDLAKYATREVYLGLRRSIPKHRRVQMLKTAGERGNWRAIDFCLAIELAALLSASRPDTPFHEWPETICLREAFRYAAPIVAATDEAYDTLSAMMVMLDDIQFAAMHARKLPRAAVSIVNETEAVLLEVSRTNRPRSDKLFRTVVGELGKHARKYILDAVARGAVEELYASLPWFYGIKEILRYDQPYFISPDRKLSKRPILKLLGAAAKGDWECHLVIFTYVRWQHKYLLSPNDMVPHMVRFLQRIRCSIKNLPSDLTLPDPRQGLILEIMFALAGDTETRLSGCRIDANLFESDDVLSTHLLKTVYGPMDTAGGFGAPELPALYPERGALADVPEGDDSPRIELIGRLYRLCIPNSVIQGRLFLTAWGDESLFFDVGRNKVALFDGDTRRRGLRGGPQSDILQGDCGYIIQYRGGEDVYKRTQIRMWFDWYESRSLRWRKPSLSCDATDYLFMVFQIF